MTKLQALLTGAAVASLASGALALASPYAAVGTSLFAVALTLAAIIAARPPGPDGTLSKLASEIEHGRRMAIYEPDNIMLAHWYLTLRGEEECARARRYGKDLSLLVVQLKPGPNDWATEAWLADWLARNIRGTDLAGRAGSGRFVVLLTETSAGRVPGLIHRMGEKLEAVELGVAAFPDDGTTFAELIAFAESRVQREAAESA
ncbi:MAG: hypothetical protein WEC75_14605 [Dehalococcoidia bacterium]